MAQWKLGLQVLYVDNFAYERCQLRNTSHLANP